MGDDLRGDFIASHRNKNGIIGAEDFAQWFDYFTAQCVKTPDVIIVPAWYLKGLGDVKQQLFQTGRAAFIE